MRPSHTQAARVSFRLGYDLDFFGKGRVSDKAVAG